MLRPGPGKKVGIYVAEDQQYHGSATYAAILDFLFFHGVSGATVMRGIAGFGGDHKMQTTSLVDLAVHLPVKIEFIETAQKVEELLPKLQAMAGKGLVEMHDTTIVKPADKKQKHPAPEMPALKREGKAKMMRIYVGENDKWNGKHCMKPSSTVCDRTTLPASRFTAGFSGMVRTGEFAGRRAQPFP